MKKVFVILIVLASLCMSCVPYRPPSPTLYVESLPQSVISEMSLEERIQTDAAWANLKRGDGERAKKIFVKLGKESPLYYAGLGYALYLLEDIQTAEDFFKAALLAFPDLILVHVGLAQIYEETGREDSAFAEYRNIMKVDPEHPWAKPRYENMKIQKTNEALQEARAYLSAGQTDKGKASYLKALFYSPASVEVHLALANLYKEEDNFQSALVHIKAASTSDPENTDTLKLYGETLLAAQDLKKSLEIYEKLVEKVPDDTQVKDQLKVIKNRLGIFELPSQYDDIADSEAVTKEDVAAIIGVKFQHILEDPTRQPHIIVDIATSWASRYILKMTTLGLLDVYPNHEFQPKKTITRAEMAEILVRLIMHLEQKGHRFIQQIPVDRIKISDVTPSNFYYQPILTIISYDIMTLSADRAFNPDAPVSGQEAIRLLEIILILVQ